MMNFFTRIDFMSLEAGNKTAGFLFNVAAPALEALNTVSISEAAWSRVEEDARTRLRRSGVLPEADIAECGLGQFNGTAVPRSFWVGRTFAGSLGAEPAELEEVADPERAPYLGPELVYSPHNVDTPAQALGLLILVQTWAEWAWGQLMVAKSLKEKAQASSSEQLPNWLSQVERIEVSDAQAEGHSEVGAALAAVADAMAPEAKTTFASNLRSVLAPGEHSATYRAVSELSKNVFDRYGHGRTDYLSSRARSRLYFFLSALATGEELTDEDCEHGLVGLYELYPAICDVTTRAGKDELPGLNELLELPAEPMFYLVNTVLKKNLNVGVNSLLMCGPTEVGLQLVRPDGHSASGLRWTPVGPTSTPKTLREQFHLIYSAEAAANASAN